MKRYTTITISAIFLFLFSEAGFSQQFGNIEFNTEDARLYITPVAGNNEILLSFEAGISQPVAVGEYRYRVVRPWFEEAVGTVEVLAGQTVSLKPEWTPLFGVLVVRTNLNRVNIDHDGAHIPGSPHPKLLFLEPGERQIWISAVGFDSLSIKTRAEAGVTKETPILILQMNAEGRQLAARELPPARFSIETDSNTELFLNNELIGTGSTSLELESGIHSLKMVHPFQTRQFDLRLEPNQFRRDVNYMLPRKDFARAYAKIFPGLGHVYTKQDRGWIYMSAGVLTGGYSLYNGRLKRGQQVRYDDAYKRYRLSRSIESAANNRQLVLKEYGKLVSYHDRMRVGAVIFGLILGTQLVDIYLTTPPLGYRQEIRFIETGLTDDGFTLRMNF